MPLGAQVLRGRCPLGRSGAGPNIVDRGHPGLAVAQPDWIALYLQEDLDDEGDITSDAIFGPDEQGGADVVARAPACVAGLQAAKDVFDRLGCAAEAHMNEGSWVDAGAVVMAVDGPVRGILAAERTALNIIGRMSGIASETRRIVERLGAACSAAVLAGTRKTTPGFRAFEKEAIRIGGGAPHRAGLYDEAMIKDNHREAAGSVRAAVEAVRQAWPDKVLTTEVESLEDALAAAAAGTHWILIDNQDPAVGKGWAEQVWDAHPDVKVEASGGITPDNVADFAWADRISLGALTHQARSIDFGLDWRTS